MGKRKGADSATATSKKAKATAASSGAATTTSSSAASGTGTSGTSGTPITSDVLLANLYTKDYEMKEKAILFFRRLQSNYGGKKRTPKLEDELCQDIKQHMDDSVVEPWDIKTVLKLNDQAAGGNEAEITSKLADGVLRGGLPRCPKCFGGRLRYGMPKWESKGKSKRTSPLKGKERFHCPGYFDDDQYVNCYFEALDGVDRIPWKYP